MIVAYWDNETKTQKERDMTAEELAQREIDIFASYTTSSQLISKIDRDVDAIYEEVIGNRGEEYTTARNEAVEFRDADYQGKVPPSVESWAVAKNWTAKKAADDILEAAARLSNLRENIRAQRLLKKEQVRAASIGHDVMELENEWDQIVLNLRSIAGI